MLTGGTFLAFATGVYLMRFLRRRPKGTDPPKPMIFDLAEMQAMLASGQITPEEFDRLREIVLKRQTDPIRPMGRGYGFEVLLTQGSPASQSGRSEQLKTE